MADLDTFSDSDWLNVSSDRSDRDSDLSFTDHESDHDEISSNATRSRRSSVSEQSSLNGENDFWVGATSDIEDVAGINGMYTVPSQPSVEAEQHPTVDLGPLNPNPSLAEEDERVREALDQSFVGTLSGSRSGTSGPQSTHTSIRDLRLSFPDPLTSSRNELNRSYEAISSPTESSHNSSDDISENQDRQPDIPITNPPSYTLQDPGLFSITPAVQRHEVFKQELEQSQSRAELDIILYGKSSEIKWKFVQDLIQKAASASGHLCLNNLRNDAGENVQILRLIKKSQHFAPFFNTITVYDRTDGAHDGVGIDLDSDSPSLAIVYLPTAKLPVLSWHSAYLPVLLPFSPLSTEAYGPMADDDWELLAVPADKTIKLGVSKSPVFDSDEVGVLNPDRAYEVLSDIGNDARIELALKPLTEQVKSVNAVTFFAVMSIIMGFALNTAFRPSIPSPTPTVNMATSRGGIWGLMSPQPNRSAIAYCKGSSANSGTSIMSASSAKDMALSVFLPGSTSLALSGHAPTSMIPITGTTKEVAPIVNTSPAPKCLQCATPEPEPVKVSSEVSLRSPTSTSLSVIHKTTVKPVTVVAAATTRAVEPTRTADAPIASGSGTSGRTTPIQPPSVSDAFDETVKTINEDITEIFEAADDLLLTLRTQTDNVIRNSKGKARAFGEQMRNLNEGVAYRNSRAQARAKELRERGEKILSSAKQEFMEHTRRAKKQAKRLKENVLQNANMGAEEVMKSYERAQEEWEGVLKGRDRSRSTVRRAERKMKRRERRDASKENRGHEDCWTQKKAFAGGGGLKDKARRAACAKA
ncbi:hypothetical protein CVT24_008091 [Panaeolus cyanescens]|uniref:Uncharacterized protein n=1 Tax=Panaeolus cyanescens TaxID=181874 RepID=A0A409YLF2_9AGAR|nr:hypothetical protein CVT24_008091 [Panaeolus cyanescens]